MHSVCFLCKEMPPRKRKSSHQALEKQVAAKRQGRVQPAEVLASTTPELETTISDPANYMAVTTQQDQGTVVAPPPPPPSSGLQFTISFTSANGESDYDPLPICTFNDLDIFITDASKQKIWNSEYIDLALLLRQNFCPNTDTMGTLTVVNNQLTVKTGAPKIKVPINSIELWTDAFINFTMVFSIKHQENVAELLKYMTVIRGAAVNSPIQR